MKFYFLIVFIFLYFITKAHIYNFEITNVFELKDNNLAYLAFSESELYLYDSTENKIHLTDLNGLFLGSLKINFKSNGIDVYKDTVYVQKEILSNKKSSILKINYNNGEVYDSITWPIGDNAKYAKLLCVNSNYVISYISEGWSSRIVQIDMSGAIINSIVAPGLGSPVDFSFISTNKFCLITNTASSENGYYFEYEIESDEIHLISSLEIPVKDPLGIAFVNDSTFYVYSGIENKIYKISKIQSVTNLELVNVIEKDVIIYPNPTKFFFRIGTNIKIDKIEILKANGEKMNYTQNNDLVYFDKFPNGIYYIVLFTDNNIITKKLIIR